MGGGGWERRPEGGTRRSPDGRERKQVTRAPAGCGSGSVRGWTERKLQSGPRDEVTQVFLAIPGKRHFLNQKGLM